MSPLISIIIPTYNEEANIAVCLQSLLSQSYKNVEIFIVDDGSTDKTIEIIDSFIKKTKAKLPIKLLTQKHQGPGAARNKAAKIAKGDILVFVDADMTFDKHFIDKLTLPIRSGQTIGTFTKEEYVANNDNIYARSWSLIRGWEDGRMHPSNYPDSQNVFRAIKASVFKKSGGFDQNRGYDDDWSISEKSGKLATSAKGAILYHNNPDSLTDIYIQSKWMAKRRYKFGFLGKLIALIRLSLIFSLIRSYNIARKNKFNQLFNIQLVSDLGQMRGILESFMGNSSR